VTQKSWYWRELLCQIRIYCILGNTGLSSLEQIGSRSNTSELYLRRLHLVAGPNVGYSCKVFFVFRSPSRQKQ